MSYPVAGQARDSVSKADQRLPRVVSSEVSETADALRSQGKEVLTLCGAPFWPPPEHIVQAAERAGRENMNPPSRGFLELRQAISAKLESEGIVADPRSQILVTHGAMHALSLVCTTMLDPGDEVLMYRPSFFFFGPIRLANGVPVYADTREDQD